MPNRIIKDSIHTSETVNAMNDFQFRLWINLITYVDDYGRGDARPAVIKGTCFPLRDRLTNKNIEAALNALAGIGCVGLYEVDGKPYLYFPNWESHQRIRQRVSKYPEPALDDSPRQVAASCGELLPESNPNPNPESESRIQNPKENSARARFTPPTLQEVTDYCKERGNRIDPAHFIDFYEAKGWKVGNTPMKDWKAAIRTWEQRDRTGTSFTGSAPKVNPALQYSQREYTREEANNVYTSLDDDL